MIQIIVLVLFMNLPVKIVLSKSAGKKEGDRGKLSCGQHLHQSADVLS